MMMVVVLYPFTYVYLRLLTFQLGASSINLLHQSCYSSSLQSTLQIKLLRTNKVPHHHCLLATSSPFMTVICGVLKFTYLILQLNESS